MRERRKNGALAMALGLLAWAVLAHPSPSGASPSGRQTAFGLEHMPLSSFEPGRKLVFRAATTAPADWMTLYFRTPEVPAFQARPMAKSGSAPGFVFELDTGTLASSSFEYYLEAEKGGERITLPARAPEALIRVNASGGEAVPGLPEDLPSPAAELVQFSLPIHANGTFEASFAEQNSAAGAVDPNLNGNLRVSVETRDSRGLGFMSDGNFALSNMPVPGGKKVDLSNMMVSLTSGGHAVRAGDLIVNESEFTAAGYNRRGIEYAFESPAFTLHAFDLSSQLMKGFKGIGVPPASNNVFGAAAGVKLFKDMIALKAIYVGGKDDPSMAGNLGVSSSFQSRKGNVISLIEETRLFNNAFSLRAEYALSNYDANVEDESPRDKDHAYLFGAGLALGGFSVNAAYRFVGLAFNSIGLQYIASDRKGVDANFQFAKGPVSFQAQVNQQQDNVRSDPSRLTTKGLTGNALANLTLSQALMLNAGYRLVDQKSYEDGASESVQDTVTNELSGGLVLNLSTAFSLNAALTQSKLTSRSNPAGDAEGLTINVGTMLRLGEIFSLAPTLGVSRTKTIQSGEENTTLNGFLTGEIFIIRKVLSFQFAGSYNRMAMTVMATQRTFEVLGGANVYVGELLKLGQLMVSLKGQLRETDSGGEKVRMTRLLAQGTLAF